MRSLDGLVVSHDDNDHAGGAVSVLQALPQPVIVIDEDRKIVFVNYSAETFFGYSPEWLLDNGLLGTVTNFFGETIAEVRALCEPKRDPNDPRNFDAEGNLWVAQWGGWQVACYDPATGKKVDKATAVIVAQADGSVLYFASEETLQQYQKK